MLDAIFSSTQLRLVALLLACPATYLTYGAILYQLQDAILFPVPQTSREVLDHQAAQIGARIHQPVAEDGTELYAWHLPGRGERLLVFFHGNGGGIGAASWFSHHLPGFDVVTFSYRGYPGSEGQPSEAGMVLDARAVWAMVTEQLGFAPGSIVLHGQSLGGGVLNHLLTEVRPAAATFDSTFSSVQELARRRAPGLPVGLLLRHPFRSIDRAPSIELPVLVMHGDADTLIPVSHGRRMAEAYPDARYVEIPGRGHNDWLLDDPVAQAAWVSFVQAAVP